MAISDVRSFPDYEFMDVGDYQPIRLDTITISTEAYDSMQNLINRLKAENKELKEKLNAINS